MASAANCINLEGGAKRKASSPKARVPARKRRRRGRHQGMVNFSGPIHKILKEVQAGKRITKGAVQTLNAMLNNLLVRMRNHITSLRDKRATATDSDVQAAAKLVMDEGLAMHATFAVKQGMRAAAFHEKGKRYLWSGNFKAIVEQDGARLHSKYYCLAFQAVMNYIAKVVLESAGEAARERKVKTIATRDIAEAIHDDVELLDLFRGTVPHAPANTADDLP